MKLLPNEIIVSSDQDVNDVRSILNLCQVKYLLHWNTTQISSLSSSTSDHDFICRYKYEQKDPLNAASDRSLIPLTEADLLETDQNMILPPLASPPLPSSSSRKRLLATEQNVTIEYPSRKSKRLSSSDSSTPSPPPAASSEPETKDIKIVSKRQTRASSLNSFEKQEEESVNSTEVIDFTDHQPTSDVVPPLLVGGDDEDERDDDSKDFSQSSSMSSFHEDLKYAEILTQMSAERVVHDLRESLDDPKAPVTSSQENHSAQNPCLISSSIMNTRRHSALYHELYGTSTNQCAPSSLTRIDTQRNLSASSALPSSFSTSLPSYRSSLLSSFSIPANLTQEHSPPTPPVSRPPEKGTEPFLRHHTKRAPRIGQSFQVENIPDLITSFDPHTNTGTQQIWNPDLCSPHFNHLQYLQRAASLVRRYCATLLSQENGSSQNLSSSMRNLLLHSQTDPTNSRRFAPRARINGSYIAISSSNEDLYLEALFLRY